MATNKKSPYFVTLGTGADAQVQLDPDIYTSAVLTELGLSATKTANAKVLRVPIATLAASSFAGLVRVTCVKGAGTPEEETRQIRLLCEASKLDTAKAALAGKTVKLGYGAAAVDWTIQA
ncbi:MAG: hypothetical protein DCE90_14030 [Pseudanabaena sp.]|nr:MAG: hypothetical protein DCE90_14030 [Pseudanabaena sp.]